MVVMAAFLLIFVFAIGIIYLRLHALPDHLAHHKVQFQIVCVLGLIAMFTHMHIFWIAGLLLAIVDIPDFITPLRRIAGSIERMAARNATMGRDGTPTRLHHEAHINCVGNTIGSDRP